MKHLKHLLIALCLAVAVLAVLPKAEAAYSGTCGANGSNLTWTLDDAGTLAISGTGAMKDWSSSLSVPWSFQRGYHRACRQKRSTDRIL